MRIDKVSKLDNTVVAVATDSGKPKDAEIVIAAVPTKNVSRLLVVVGTSNRPATARDVQDLEMALKSANSFFPTIDIDRYDGSTPANGEPIKYEESTFLTVKDDVKSLQGNYPNHFLFILIGNENRPPILPELLQVQQAVSSIAGLKAIITHGFVDLFVY